MKVIKKFTAVKLNTEIVNDFVKIVLNYGDKDDWCQRVYDTEQEAIDAAYKNSKYAEWLILPIIRFDNFDD